MVSFFVKLYKAFKASYLLDKSWEAISRNQIDIADSNFSKAEKIIGDLCAEHLLMKAYIKFRAENYKDAKILFDKVWVEIESDKCLTEEEKEYFKAFTLKPAEVTLNYLKINTRSEAFYTNVVPFDISIINLASVPEKWKIHFPIRSHPDWVSKV